MASSDQINKQPLTALLMVESAVASSGALIISNPFELLKTRLQLQGELQSAAATKVVYRGMLHGIYSVGKTEGVGALYQGINAAILHQIAQNGVRFGTYIPTKTYLENHLGQGMHTNVASAFLVGVAGAVASNPAFLMKTRFQAMNRSSSADHSAKIGKQHQYTGIMDAFRQIYKQGGLMGFMHGVSSTIWRTGVGSAAQLPMYDFVKERGIAHFQCDATDIRLHIFCSMAAAANIVLFMNPFDVLNVRCFNDPAHRYSSNPVKALMQIVKIEGVAGLYKGALPLWWRTAPHSTATFVLLEQIRSYRHETSAVFFPFLFEDTV